MLHVIMKKKNTHLLSGLLQRFHGYGGDLMISSNPYTLKRVSMGVPVKLVISKILAKNQ